MLSLKLSRVGKKKQPSYRIVVVEKSKDPWGKSVDVVGHIDPLAKPEALVKLDEAKIKSWLAKGAQPTDTVWNLLVDKKLVEGEKRRNAKISKKRKEKLAKKQA